MCPRARWDRRRPLRPLESFTFGSAMSVRSLPEDAARPPRGRPLAGPRGDPAGLRVRLGDQALLLLDRPVGLLDLLREAGPQVVDQLDDLLLVHHHLVGERDAASVMDQVLHPVDDLVDLQRNFSSRRFATTGGTNWLTSRP